MVAVLVAASNGEQARPDQVGVGVSDVRRIVPIGQASGKTRCKVEPSLDAARHQHAAVRRQPPAIEAGAQFLARHG
jgi:hypothetical protein